MVKNKETRECKFCGTEFKKYRTTDKYCSGVCQFKDKKPDLTLKSPKPIRKISKKQAVLNAQYLVANKEFLSKAENQICPVTKQKATEVHHKKGRVGYADEWARENNIPLSLDVRFFLAVSRKGHRQIEENPEWAKEMGYSLSRLTNE